MATLEYLAACSVSKGDEKKKKNGHGCGFHDVVGKRQRNVYKTISNLNSLTVLCLLLFRSDDFPALTPSIFVNGIRF